MPARCTRRALGGSLVEWVVGVQRPRV